jgi:hypothetical protein
MSEDPGRETGAVRKEEELREHEREARERAEDEREPLGTPDEDAVPAPPGNAGANLGGAS